MYSLNSSFFSIRDRSLLTMKEARDFRDPYKRSFFTSDQVLEEGGMMKVFPGNRMDGDHGHLVHELITKTGFKAKFRKRLGEDNGSFTESEVQELLPSIFKYVSTLRSQPPYVWAVGVLTYFLLCGNQRTTEPADAEFYRQSGLGSPLPHISLKERLRGPRPKYYSLSEDAQDFIYDITSCLRTDVISLAEAENHPWILSTLDLDFGDDAPTVSTILGQESNPSCNNVPVQPQISNHQPVTESISSTNPLIEKPKDRVWIDTGGFRSRIKTQKGEVNEEQQREQKNYPSKKETAKTWNTFMKTASKASRKTKRKLRSEERKRKKEKKELMQKNTDEWWNLYHRVTNWNDWRFSEEDMKRYIYLTNHAALDKGQIPSFLYRQAK